MHIDTYNLTAGSPLQSTMEEEQLSTSSAFSKWPDALSWSLIGSAHTNQMLCEPLRPTAPSDRHVGEIPCSSKTWFNQISWELPPTTTTQQKLDPHTPKLHPIVCGRTKWNGASCSCRQVVEFLTKTELKKRQFWLGAFRTRTICLYASRCVCSDNYRQLHINK